jgi:hypothetical protein
MKRRRLLPLGTVWVFISEVEIFEIWNLVHSFLSFYQSFVLHIFRVVNLISDWEYLMLFLFVVVVAS